jgi:hypothetical protein
MANKYVYKATRIKQIWDVALSLQSMLKYYMQDHSAVTPSREIAFHANKI